MDEKHRQYCIKLGNPYMMEEKYQSQVKVALENDGYSYFQNEKIENQNWFNNKKVNY